MNQILFKPTSAEGAFDLEMNDDSDDPDAQNGGSMKMQKKAKKGSRPF